MTRSDLIEQLAERMNVSNATAERVVVTMFDSMAEALIGEGRVEIRGFGSFQVREYEGYTGRNPKTGEKVTVTPKKLPFFKTGKELKERIADSTP